MTQDLPTVQEIVARGESETVEFKRSTAERDPAAKTLCAMLNHQGGSVLFGVDPHGKIVGQEVSGHTIERIVQQFAKIDPPIFPTVSRVNVRDELEVIVVTVSRGNSPPYSYNGRAWRRVGNTSRALSRDEYNNMVLQFMHATRRWENEPEPTWTIADLDVDEITRTVETAVEIGRLTKPEAREPFALLRGLGLTSEDMLLRAAVVLFGKKNRLAAEYTQCTVRAARFLGTDKSESSDNRQFHGNAIELLAKSQEFVREHLRIASRFEPDNFVRIDEPSYPPLAVREALANAICHRDYSFGGSAVHVAMYDDRLEITSPGSLPAEITPEDLYVPHRSVPWNPLIASVFFRRGVVEMWGEGTLKMAKLAAAGGLPRPEIEDGRGSVTVRFRPNGHIPRYVHVKLTQRHRRILALLTKAGPMPLRQIVGEMRRNATEMQTQAKSPRSTTPERQRIQDELHELRAYRLVECWGWGPGARWERT